MNILVTGNRGYVGSILTKLLIEKGYNVIGLDANFYKECNFDEQPVNSRVQHKPQNRDRQDISRKIAIQR